jgi:hypothetical protein
MSKLWKRPLDETLNTYKMPHMMKMIKFIDRRHLMATASASDIFQPFFNIFLQRIYYPKAEFIFCVLASPSINRINSTFDLLIDFMVNMGFEAAYFILLLKNIAKR